MKLRRLKPENRVVGRDVLSFELAGAEAYNAGTITGTAKAGVKAFDDVALEMTKKEPAAYNDHIAGMSIVVCCSRSG